MPLDDRNKRLQGCLRLLAKILVLALAAFFLGRELFELGLNSEQPAVWALSSLAGAVLIIILARWAYRKG